MCRHAVGLVAVPMPIGPPLTFSKASIGSLRRETRFTFVSGLFIENTTQDVSCRNNKSEVARYDGKNFF